MHMIIIGGVAAGSKAAVRARRVNPDMDITLYQDETEIAYSACGEPYYLSGLIPKRDSLIIRRPADFASQDIDVRVNHRITRLDTLKQTVSVYDQQQNTTFQDSYDRLVLATGARSIVPDNLACHLDGVITLNNLAELDRFKLMLQRLQPQRAVVVGSGYIGLELIESLSCMNIEVTLLGRNQQIFSRLDKEMSQSVHEYLLSQKMNIITGDGIAQLVEQTGRVREVVTLSGTRLPTDLVVLALGVSPNVELAEQAGIALGTTGAIAVNERMETNISGVFAAGDCAESRHRLTDLPIWSPLGDIANLQGRIAGENAAGGNACFPGVFGTSIFKTFALHVGMTGLTEVAALAGGYTPISTVIDANDKARYYPGNKKIKLKLVANAEDGQLLGAQAVGTGAVDKSIDIAATALLGKLRCQDLENADLAYAPPFSPVLSPIIVAAGAICKQLR